MIWFWLFIFFLVCVMFVVNFVFVSIIDLCMCGVLDFIGSIEGFVGYDDYYWDVFEGLFCFLIFMIINEVLVW